MDIIKFNEGGQPLYLDDLQKLQTFTLQLMKMFITALSYGQYTNYSCMWLLKPATDSSSTSTAYTGYLWHEDYGIMEVTPGSTWTTEPDEYYVNIIETPTDYRTLDNGQSEACGVKYTAVMSKESGGVASYATAHLNDFITILKSKLS